jgi:hypothetical protein
MSPSIEADYCGVQGPEESGGEWTVQESESWVDTFESSQEFCEMHIGLSDQKKLAPLRNIIESSRSILELHDDWDDEGSIGYKEETWNRATQFVLNSARFLWDHHTTIMDTPDIGPGPDGSIDIHWETEKYELLVNISADLKALATFYGDNKGSLSIKGNLNPDSDNPVLLCWLKTFV